MTILGVIFIFVGVVICAACYIFHDSLRLIRDWDEEEF